MFSPEWESYVLSLFTSKELADGKPRMMGLKRVVQLLFGRINEERLDLVSENDNTVCIYTCSLKDAQGEFITGAGSGDCNDKNAGVINNGKEKVNLSIYPTAIAESRARSRCYRFMLGLSVIAAEEPQGGILDNISEVNITDSQKLLSKNIAKEINVNLDKVVRGKYNKQVDSLTMEQAAELIKALHGWKKEPDKINKNFLLSE